MTQKVDRRTLRTKKVLKELLVQQLMTRSLEQITVRELTDLAGLSRGTFYLHFKDLFALYQEVEDDVLHGITQTVQECASAQAENRLESIITGVMSYLA